MQTETESNMTATRTRKEQRNPRGVFEKVPGSGEWWICFWDAQGRKRREKAGTKSNAITLYRKRKMEALEGKKLPEKLRRAAVSFAAVAKDALAYSKIHKAGTSYRCDAGRSPKSLLDHPDHFGRQSSRQRRCAPIPDRNPQEH